MIEATGTRFLLPGDIERKIELALYSDNRSALDAEVLIAPHHGSATSSSWPFTRAVTPKHVVYSVGYLNRFGHPKPEISQRYQRLGSELYRTDRDGAIVFEVKEGKLRPVTRFRERKKRFWH